MYWQHPKSIPVNTWRLTTGNQHYYSNKQEDDASDFEVPRIKFDNFQYDSCNDCHCININIKIYIA